MNAAERKLLRCAKSLAQKFFDDAQALFDDEGMTEELNDHEIFQALCVAQGYAEDVVNTEGGAS